MTSPSCRVSPPASRLDTLLAYVLNSTQPVPHTQKSIRAAPDSGTGFIVCLTQFAFEHLQRGIFLRNMSAAAAQGRSPIILDDKASGVQTPATEVTDPTLRGDQPSVPEQVSSASTIPAVGGVQFWLIFIALMVTSFLSAIDLVSPPLVFSLRKI